MLESIKAAPPDAILGLTEAFRRDPRPEKVNLGSGLYHDENGKIPVLDCVIEAERRLAAELVTKAYLPIPGLSAYRQVTTQLIFGDQHEALTNNQLGFAQTPGGSGALRVAAEFVHSHYPDSSVWLSDPTWPNHPGIFASAGMSIKKYPYYNASTMQLDFDAMCSALDQACPGDLMVLQECCHNPTGVDLTPEQWNRLADLVVERGLLPLFDFAYQGFAESIEQDASSLRSFCRKGIELLVCYSFSKNLGLYCERTGALCVVTSSGNAAEAVQTQINRTIRANYSNPPAHGARIATSVLQDPELRAHWLEEVAEMRDRINAMRSALANSLKVHAVPGDYSFLSRQRGMFSLFGLTKVQIEALRTQHAVYIVGSGRINIAGLTPTNVLRVAAAIRDVLSERGLRYDSAEAGAAHPIEPVQSGDRSGRCAELR